MKRRETGINVDSGVFTCSGRDWSTNAQSTDKSSGLQHISLKHSEMTKIFPMVVKIKVFVLQQRILF
jgi:hypothetical protein